MVVSRVAEKILNDKNLCDHHIPFYPSFLPEYGVELKQSFDFLGKMFEALGILEGWRLKWYV